MVVLDRLEVVARVNIDLPSYVWEVPRFVWLFGVVFPYALLAGEDGASGITR